MRRLLLVVAATAVAVSSAALAHARGDAEARSFRLPDASAACRAEREAVVCRSLAVRAGLALPAAGAPRAVDAPVWWDASTPVLRRYERGGVSCRISGLAIVCQNAGGATISVGTRRIAVGL